MALITFRKCLEFLSGMAGSFALLYIVALLGGCAQLGNLPAPGIHPGDAPITQREFVRTDVQTALTEATAGGDKQGQECFSGLLSVLPVDNPISTLPTGLLSILEAGRVARLQAGQGLPDAVVSACAPMVLNSQKALLNAVLFLRP